MSNRFLSHDRRQGLGYMPSPQYTRSLPVSSPKPLAFVVEVDDRDKRRSFDPMLDLAKDQPRLLQTGGATRPFILPIRLIAAVSHHQAPGSRRSINSRVACAHCTASLAAT